MVRVTIISESCDRLAFKFPNCELAGKFMEVSMQAADGNVKFEIEMAEEPAEVQKEESEGTPTLQEETIDTF